MIDWEKKRLYRQRVEKELRENILPFWIKYMKDEENGGFYGKIENDLTIHRDAPKGLVFCSRILWTYSAAYRLFQNPEHLDMAQRAYRYLLDYFEDKEYGGMYWLLDYKGKPLVDKKQIYGNAFAIYGLGEFYKATGNEESLQKAIELYHLIEKYSYDPGNRGYFEACTREWRMTEDLRLSDKDMNEKKSMNTHLHILEAYTNLYRVWKDESLKHKLKEIIEVTVDHIIDPNTRHFILFFDEYWNPKSDLISYGHDIEGSWLLWEAAEVLGDEGLLKKVRGISEGMAYATYQEGLDQDGGLMNEGGPTGLVDTDKHWWPQAEAAVGFLNAYQLTGDGAFFEASYRSWEFIEKYIIDREKGEWFWRVSKDGKPIQEEAKGDPWKGPYHNGRACMEIMARLDNI